MHLFLSLPLLTCCKVHSIFIITITCCLMYESQQLMNYIAAAFFAVASSFPITRCNEANALKFLLVKIPNCSVCSIGCRTNAANNEGISVFHFSKESIWGFYKSILFLTNYKNMFLMYFISKTVIRFDTFGIFTIAQFH